MTTLMSPRALASRRENKEVNSPISWGLLLPLAGTLFGIELADRHDTFLASKPQGYIVGRNSECDLVIDHPYVSNRHCLIYRVVLNGKISAFLRDLSSSGTFVNQTLVGCNHVVELKHGDIITIPESARFLYLSPGPIYRTFAQEYTPLGFFGETHPRQVYECQEKATGQRFAIKHSFSTVSKVFQDTKDSVVAELNLMGLCHRNIICIKEAFADDTSSFHVTQIAEKGDLFDLIVRKSRISEDDTRHIFTQLFDAVTYLHERDIVHRDLKPENILILDEKPTVMLCSFDISTTITVDGFETALCGSPSYVAPEVLAEIQYRKYGREVDIWSLGVVLYICLCGFPPFSDELYSKNNPYTLSQQIKMGRFDYLSPYWDSVDNIALDLVDSMLVVEPDRRFTAKQCLTHPWLTQATSGEQVLSKSASSLHRRPRMLDSGQGAPLSTYIACDLLQVLLRTEGHEDHKWLETIGETLASLLEDIFQLLPLDVEDGKTRPKLLREELMTEVRKPNSSGADHPDIGASLDLGMSAWPATSDIKQNALPEMPFTGVSEDLRCDIEFTDRGQELSTWTCTPSAHIPSDDVPLRIDGYPVVLPVHYGYPLTKIFSPPPDPHPLFMSPSAQLSNEDIQHVFSAFPACVGFYLLINGFLQVIMPDEFDYEEDVPSVPSEFGGLKVSLIPEAVCPTAGEPSASSPSTTTTSTRTAFERIFGQSSSQSAVSGSMRTTGPAGNSPANAVGVSVGCAIRAIVPGSKSKQRFEGKTGVAISPRDDSSKKYITIPTHLLTDAVIASKTTSLDSDTWRDDVKVCVASNLAELGEVTATFDQDPKSFPIGFSHDVSLVDISGVSDNPRTTPNATDLTWLSQQEWMDIKYNSSNLVLLDDRSREAKSIGIVDSRCQMVGQGIFRIQHQSRKRSSFLGSLSSGSITSRAQDPRDDPSTWTSLVARSILYRVHPDYPVRGGQSGVPVCIVSENTDVTASRGTKVAGFASFVQMVSDVQKYDLEGDKLYKRLQEGRVAFYGAFQVPQELRDGYRIL